MPARSDSQRRFMGAALGRKRSGKSRPDDPEMGDEELRRYARKPKRRRSGMKGSHAADALMGKGGGY